MTSQRLWAPLALAASGLLAAGPSQAGATLDQFGTLATVASFSCVTEGCDTASDLVSALLTTKVDASNGGIGQSAASTAVGGGWPNAGGASGSATVNGGLAVPVLKAGAASKSLQWLGGQALAVQSYTYTGAGETLTLGWHLTGNIDNPDNDQTTGLVMFAGFFDAAALGAFPDVSNPLGAATLLASLATASPNDEFQEITTDGVVNTNGTLSLSVTQGQQFYLVMGLMAAAGGADAGAESLSTFTAQFRGAPSLQPALLRSVPLPATAALALLGLALLPATRRRRR